MIEDIRSERRELDTRIKVLDNELIATAKTVDNCRRLCEIPGIGALNATALMAAVSNGAALPFLAARQDALGEWLRRLLVRAHCNVVIVALADKLARIAWAVLSGTQPYRPRAAA